MHWSVRPSVCCLVVSIGVLCAPAHASADLIQMAWKTPADDAITRDTLTGLEWLDLTQSLNRSHSYVEGQFGLGGEFEGFRYALLEEVRTLFGHAGFVGSATTYPDHTRGLDFMAIVGTTWAADNYAAGIHHQSAAVEGYASEHLPGGWPYWSGYALPYVETYVGTGSGCSAGCSDVTQVDVRSGGDGSAISGRGSWLVRSSAPQPDPVPEPASLLLLGTGLACAARTWRRRSSHTEDRRR